MFQSMFNLGRSKTSLFVLYFSFFALHFLAINILGSNFSLAPDEQGYLNVFRDLYSKPLQGVQDDTGWDGASDLFLWTAYLPAKALTLFGLNDLAAIRTLSVGITFITILVLVQSSGHFNSPKAHLKAILLFSIPSIFVWTSLGMREAFIFFFMGLFFWSLNRITSKKWKITALEIAVLAIASFGMLSTKNYLWAVLVFCLLMVTFWKMVVKEMSIKLIGMIFLPIILSILFYDLTSKNDSLGFITSLNSSSLVSVSTRVPISEANPRVPISEANPRVPISEANPSASGIEAIKSFVLKVTANSEDLSRDNSESKRKPYTDNYSAASFSEPLSFISASLRFIMSPLVFRQDVPFSILVASVESLVWIGLILILLVRGVQRIFSRTSSSFAQVLAIVVIFMFTLMSAGVEINLGTAYRHRSILLIPLAFLLLCSRTKKSRPAI